LSFIYFLLGYLTFLMLQAFFKEHKIYFWLAKLDLDNAHSVWPWLLVYNKCMNLHRWLGERAALKTFRCGGDGGGERV
jgi:hypothetical protein